MGNTRKLAEDYYSFILKYDECFYKKYKEDETETNQALLKFKSIFNEMIEKDTRPYTSLTKGKEIEELENIIDNDKKTLKKYLRMFDYFSDQCYDLAEIELRKYYEENNVEKSPDEILDTIDECIKNNKFDSEIFSQELIEKCNLLKESDILYDRLTQAYKNICAWEFNTNIYTLTLVGRCYFYTKILGGLKWY